MKYTRKPFEVEAIQWTGENLEEVKEFCGAQLYENGQTTWWKVDYSKDALFLVSPNWEKVSKTDYIVKRGDEFDVWSAKSFEENHDRI